MLSKILHVFLYFITCCGLQSCSTTNRTRTRTENEQDLEGGVRLDPIADPEEERSYGASSGLNWFGGRSKRGMDYSVTTDPRQRRETRRCSWVRRNKISPSFLPVAGEHLADKSDVNRQKSKEQGKRLDVSSVQDANDEIVFGLFETKDSFSERQNSALALRTFATCARLNANFMRQTAWTPTTESECDSNGTACSPYSQREAKARQSVWSRITFAWNVVRRRIFDAGARFSLKCGEGFPGTSTERNDNGISDDKKERPKMYSEHKKGARSFLRVGKFNNKGLRSSRSTSRKPVAIHKLGENESTNFDRNLYMRINKLTVTHDICQSSLSDPFFVQEGAVIKSDVPVTYITINSQGTDKGSSNEDKPRLKNFFGRFTRRTGIFDSN
ncbi:unnamed protein product [Porites evermanni]|uniref:Uncharacterized protein n=1 Tax=Porites evermanni TaxID=104178 RepID=A0ABN8MLV1_9CNID|nr:unnamed protein product [Porites evermanni]